MPRVTTRDVVDAPEELVKLAAFLRSEYGAELPQPERWRAEIRTRGAGSTSGQRDTYFTSNDEPPRQFISRVAIARHLGLDAAPEPKKRKLAAPAEANEADEADEDDSRPVLDPSSMSPEELLEAAMSGGKLMAASKPPSKSGAKRVRPTPRPASPAPAPAPPPPPAPSPKPPPPPPLFKRPTTLARAAAKPSPVVAPPPPPVAKHACSLACPLRCSGWVGLGSLLNM